MMSQALDRRTLRRMFERISEDYDFLNRLLTLGMDRRWRMKAASLCAPPERVLDLCCGAGDLLSAIMRSAGNGVRVLGVDFTPEMIARAPGDCKGSFLLADAARLPFKEGSFDCVAIAFSFRNLLYKNPAFDDCMSEVLRILRRGGRFLVLETSQPEREVIRRLFHLYLGSVVPFVGGLASGSGQAYRYLSLSALAQPTPDEVTARLIAAGFEDVEFRPLTLGIVGIHVATK